MDDDQTEPQPAATTSPSNALENFLVERSLRATAFPIKYVGYMDMLGFGALVTEHPGSLDIHVGTSSVETYMSKSSQRFGGFHAVVDKLAMNYLDASRPERMMIFSDCAFGVYDNALQAAVSLSGTMRSFLHWGIPVRMCIAKGTCHFERFSIESFQSFNLTRSMFYGSGIVSAVRGEEKAGNGCRIFLSTSLDGTDIASIQGTLNTLPLATPNKHCTLELNYLHTIALPDEPDPVTEDLKLWAGLVRLRNELKSPIDPHVLEHYTDSFTAFNAMREQFNRYKIPPPAFST